MLAVYCSPIWLLEFELATKDLKPTRWSIFLRKLTVIWALNFSYVLLGWYRCYPLRKLIHTPGQGPRTCKEACTGDRLRLFLKVARDLISKLSFYIWLDLVFVVFQICRIAGNDATLEPLQHFLYHLFVMWWIDAVGNPVCPGSRQNQCREVKLLRSVYLGCKFPKVGVWCAVFCDAHYVT